MSCNQLLTVVAFQSTPLIRGATRCPRCRLANLLAISIHAPHTRSDFDRAYVGRVLRISIHAPHTRSDKVGGKC